MIEHAFALVGRLLYDAVVLALAILAVIGIAGAGWFVTLAFWCGIVEPLRGRRG